MSRAIYHTSPHPIKKIEAAGLLGSGLCFADSPYSLNHSESDVVYKLEIDDSEIIEATSLLYRDPDNRLATITSAIMERWGVDEDAADELLARQNDGDHGIDDDEAGWELQRLALEAAKLLGYRGVLLRDEQGPLYLIDLLGRESELQAVEVTQ